MTSIVSVNSQADVFTSEKPVENVQNFRAGRKENSKCWLHTSVVFSRTYMNAQQALRFVKYYFICMKISRPVEAGCLRSRRTVPWPIFTAIGEQRKGFHDITYALRMPGQRRYSLTYSVLVCQSRTFGGRDTWASAFGRAETLALVNKLVY